MGAINTRLVLMAGTAGSGKTYLSKKLLKALPGYTILDKDPLTCVFAETILKLLPTSGLWDCETAQGPHDRESTAYLRYVRPLEYQCLMKQALQLIDLRLSVIISAPFIAEVKDDTWLCEVSSQVEALNAKLKIIWVHAKPDTVLSRLIVRGAERDNWKISNWQTYLETAPDASIIRYPYLAIDNSLDSDETDSEKIQHAKRFILDLDEVWAKEGQHELAT